MMKILIADDHAIVRKGIVELLREEFPTALMTEANNSAEVLERVKNQIWDIIIMDISMPGRNGIETLKQLRDDGVKAPVLILSMHPSEQYAVRSLKAGASGFLNKNHTTEELLVAVQRVLSGRKYITPDVAEQLTYVDNKEGGPLHSLLSDREMQVLQLLASGKTVTEVADEISLSVNTISTYRSRILEKLNLSNNAELTRYALDNGLV